MDAQKDTSRAPRTPATPSAPQPPPAQRARSAGPALRLSVIIPVYDSAATLEACLDALDAQTIAPDAFEVLVVDNNSTDGAADIARRHPRARLLREPEQGAYAARNRALAEARAPTLAFTDPDCTPDPDWLEQIEAAFDADPAALILIGPADAAGSSRSLQLLSRYERHKDAFVLDSADVQAYYGHTNNMAVRQEVFEALGPFENRQRGGDTILVRRAADRFGPASVRYLPPMRVRHLEIDSARTYFRKVRTYAASSQRYREVVPARPLTLAERLSVFRATARADRLAALDSARLLTLLALGMAHWQIGSLAARRPPRPPPPPRAPRARRRPKPETIEQHFARAGLPPAAQQEVIHPRAIARNPLPENITSSDQLPDDAGWWGYSFRDVPRRPGGETFIARIPHCRIISACDPHKEDDFYPAILTSDSHALDLREIRFRPIHAAALRRVGPTRRIERATWIIERVYHNHSHWLTAHLPKLLLLQQRGELAHVLLPEKRTPAMDASMRMAGMAPEEFPTFATGELLEVDQLTILGTDRFRPELLRMVPEAIGVPASDGAAHRRIFISRGQATRRRLVNEDDIWAMLQPAGFERICMEDLTFQQQAELMGQTAVLVAPHGAGLTNMLLCPPGTRIVEMADLSFPNPNFYAMAAALGHRYWIIEAESVGRGHPLRRDMRVDPRQLAKHLDHVLNSANDAATALPEAAPTAEASAGATP